MTAWPDAFDLHNHPEREAFAGNPEVATAGGTEAGPWFDLRCPTLPMGCTVGGFRVVAPFSADRPAQGFRAERPIADGVQVVALRLLRPEALHDPGARRRFRRALDRLEQLDHPNIAPLLEGGISVNGLPYLALEPVAGEPITLAAAQRRLDLHTRLRLCVQLCRAAAAAHAALILHCDLQPATVLLEASGALKVLAFGLARMLTDEAGDTPEPQAPYAAPELFRRSPPTVAADVYAIGILMAELLTGRAAAGRPSALLAAPESVSPAGLPERAQLQRLLRGDLDAIVHTATLVDPARRYASAEALAQDLERYLTGGPVMARPLARADRLGKFMWRNRRVALAVSVTLLALITSLVLALWHVQRARQEATRASTVRDFLLQVFDAARASQPRDLQLAPEALVAQATARLSRVSALDGATRLELDRTLSSMWLTLGRHDEAAITLARGLELAALLDSEAMTRELQLLEAEHWLAVGRHPEAAQALAALLPELGRTATALHVRTHSALATAEVAAGRLESALAHAREAARLAAAVHGADSVHAVAAELDVGGTLSVIGRHAEAAMHLEPQLLRWLVIGAPTDDRHVKALNNLAVSRDALGQTDGSEAALRDVLALKRQIYPAVHESVARTLRSLAALRSRQRDHAGAALLLDEALEMQRQLLGADHLEVAKSLDALGVLQIAQGHVTSAQQSYREALAICGRARFVDDVCPRAQANLGRALHRQGQLAAAEQSLRIALAGRRELYGPRHLNVAISMSRLAEVVADRGAATEAIQLANDARQMLKDLGHAGSREAALAEAALARALARDRQFAAALRAIDGALALWQNVAASEHDRRVPMLVLKAQLLRTLGQPEHVHAVLEEIRTLAVPPAQLWPATQRRLAELGAD